MTDYYQTLRITPGASESEVILAYRQVKQAFAKGSMAAYSLYDEDDLASIRQQIEEAYAVLSDCAKRRAYDVQHGHVDEEQVSVDR